MKVYSKEKLRNIKGKNSMKLKIYISILLVIVLFSASCDSCSDVKDGLSYEEYLEMASQYVNNNNVEKAICATKKALTIRPSEAGAHFILGELYSSEEKRTYSEAWNKYAYSALMNQKTRGGGNQIKELEALGYKSNYKRLAILEYMETVKYSPEHWQARYFIATDHFNHKRYKEAIDEYKQVIKYTTEYSSAYALLGEAYLEVGACNAAIDNFTKAYKLDSNADSYYCDIGKVYIKMGNAEKTTEMINKLKGKKTYYERLTGYQFEPHGKCEPEPVNIK